MIFKFFFGCALLLSFCGNAQTVSNQVHASDGGYYNSSGGSVAFTIGEPVSETYKTSTNISTLGFHQPEQADIVNMIKEQGSDVSILVFPNPVKDELNINLSGLAHGNYTLEIIDALGKLIYKTNTEVSDDKNSLSIKTSDYASGNYFLNISNSNFNKSIKITKTN